MNDEKNERAEVREIKGLVADDLPGALREMQAVASGSRSGGNFMYQANINPQRGEQLTPEQWREAVDTLERNLGLEDHQRVVVEHVKEGRQHYHIIWNRVDVDTMRVADMGGNWRTHERTQAELEQRFGLTPTPERQADKARPAELWELRAAERSGIDPAAMKDELTGLWRVSDSGTAFAAAIEERGYILARGDRRDFCVIDAAGDAHSLARRLDGVKAADVRAMMADVDRDSLPSVVEGRAEQRARAESFLRDDIGFGEPTEAAIEQFTPAGSWEPHIADDSLPSAAPAVQGAERGALMVSDAVAGTVEKLADFMADFFAASPAAPQPRDQVERIIAQRQAAAAMDNIRESIQEHRAIGVDDLRCLHPETIRGIKEGGDDYLRELVSRLEVEQERARAWSRERER